jgi:hypothetical protein
MVSLLKEYLSVRDIQEVKLCLIESPKEAPGYFIDALLSIFMDTNNNEYLALLMKLISDDSVVEFLSNDNSRYMIECALQSYEPLQILLDTLNDNSKAHERLGTVIGHLIRIKACNAKVVENIVNNCCSAEQAELQDVSVEDLKATYRLFVNALQL